MTHSPCVEWQKARQNKGYGVQWRNGRLKLAHRVAYELAKGPIPDGLVIDHLCRNHACVNPDHLEAVEFAENVRRGNARNHAGIANAAAVIAKKSRTHCKHGHEYTPENTRYRTSGARQCRTCVREQAKKSQRKMEADRESPSMDSPVASRLSVRVKGAVKHG